MKLRLTLHRGGSPVDVTVTADATATVGDVARALRTSDPAGDPNDQGGYTLDVANPAGGPASSRILDAGSTVAESALLSGAHVALARSAQPTTGAAPVARVRVLSGPDAGREFPIGAGASVVGRDREAEIRLSDPMVSKRHARLNIGDAVEIVDLNSANGIRVSDDVVVRSAVSGSDVISLGDTTLAVAMLQQTAPAAGSPQIEHIRSPRVVAPHPGETITAPTPPKPPQRQRFPYIALVAPLIMGAVIFVLTQQLLGVVMMAMSPLLLVGAFFDQSMTARRQLKAERKVFDEAMTATRERTSAAQGAERVARLAELPATGELAAHADRLGPLLWTERPESDTFLQLNAGIGTMPSRTTIELPSAQDTLPDCWERLLELRSDFTSITEVPVPIVLADSGAVGYAGSRALIADVARAAVFQLVAKHSPAEVVVTAVVSPATRADWEWLKWLPHSRSVHSPLRVSHLADHRTAVSALLSQIDGLIDSRVEGPAAIRPAIDRSAPRSSERRVPPIPAVVLVVEDSAPVDRARVTRLAERGADAGVHVVWIAPRVEQLPAACRSFVSVGADGAATVGQVRLGETLTPVAVETLSAPVAERLARGLAPVIDAGVPESDDSDLPRSVPFPSLTGLEILDSPDAVVERWRQNDSITLRDGSKPVPRKREGNLRALVGHAGSEPFALDLRTDGPHALVGGTTGAGKSEFLQAWVLGMAAAHSPDRLTFLFVDYKGGSAFADCVALPHTVGLVTDLSPHLVRRALTSLKAELRYREHLLNAKKAKDLVTLEKTGDPDCPPSLIIVVDEFAALVKEVPEFVDGVVDVAQRGRSLGLHLVLATQRPAGVISDNLRANTNLRIALRMADAEDSADILGDKMAAYFDPSVPGRGAAKRGPGRITSFQTGYAGGRTTGRIPPPRIEVNELDFGAEALWEAPRDPADDVVETGPTDIARIVATVKGAAQTAHIPAPRRPWLDELATIYNFEKLPNPHTDERLPIGVIDDPANQAQPVVHWEPDRDGNLAIYGTGGSGKSTALRTIAVAAAATRRHGGPTHVYGLDFGARGLSMLDGLAHVGAIISGDDEERVVRTIRMLRDLVDERAVRYAAVRAATITEYRRLAGVPEEPRILLLVDGIGAFKEQYEFGPQHLSQWFTAFAQIAADGRGVGVHLVVAGDRPNALPASISSTVQRRIVLRMANEDEYLALGVPRDVVGPTSPPGRGILDGGEVQLAILGESSNVAVQARDMEGLARGMRRAGLVPPAEVQRLAEHVRLADLPAGRPGTAVIGLDDLSLQPAAIATRGAFLLAGPPSSGRTTALETLAAGVQRADMSVRRILLTTRRSGLTSAPWHAAAVGADEVSRLIASLQPDFESDSAPPTALFIESLPEFTGTSVEYELDPFIKAVLRGEHFVVGEGETSTWGQAYTLAQPFKAGRTGLLLAPGDIDGDNLLGTSLGRIRRSELPPGRGFLIAKGRFSKLQIAQVHGRAPRGN